MLYAFTDSEELKKLLVETTRSGNIVFNDVFQQMDGAYRVVNGAPAETT